MKRYHGLALLILCSAVFDLGSVALNLPDTNGGARSFGYWRGITVADGLRVGAGVAAAYVLFALALIALIHAFRLRKSYALSAAFALYLFLHNAIANPALFDEWPWLGRTLRFLTLHFDYRLVKGWAAVIVLSLWFSLLRSGLGRRPLFRVAAASVCTLALALVFWRWPVHSARRGVADSAPAATLQRKNIVFIGIDGLRFDTQLDLEGAIDDRPLTFPFVVTPLASTLPAYKAIFSGVPPDRNGQRFPFPDPAEASMQAPNAALEELQKLGYRTEFMIDDSRFLYFSEGAGLDRFQGPRLNFGNFAFPLFLRSPLIFGAFNNPLGYLLLPDLRANFAYANTYRLEYFTEAVASRLADLGRSGKPFFLSAHTSALHWPSSYRYPYYKRGGIFKSGPHPFSLARLHPNEFGISGLEYGAEMRERFLESYDLGVRMVTREFVIPILAQLRELGLLDRTVVVLMSDHGETFWSTGPFPDDKAPKHGFSLVAEDDSDLAFMRIFSAFKSSRLSPCNLGLQDLVPLASALASPDFKEDSLNDILANHPLQFSESGIWQGAYFPDATVLGIRTLFDMVEVSEAGGNVKLHEGLLPLLEFQKERAVYEGPFRLTLFPAVTGYRLFLCDRLHDPSCRTNAAASDRERTRRLLSAILEHWQADRESGALPALHFDANWPSFPRMIDDPAAPPWLRLQAASEAWFADLDSSGHDELLRLANDPAVPGPVREIAGRRAGFDGPGDREAGEEEAQIALDWGLLISSARVHSEALKRASASGSAEDLFAEIVHQLEQFTLAPGQYAELRAATFRLAGAEEPPVSRLPRKTRLIGELVLRLSARFCRSGGNKPLCSRLAAAAKLHRAERPFNGGVKQRRDHES
jgi:hypothetical protein